MNEWIDGLRVCLRAQFNRIVFFANAFVWIWTMLCLCGELFWLCVSATSNKRLFLIATNAALLQRSHRHQAFAELATLWPLSNSVRCHYFTQSIIFPLLRIDYVAHRHKQVKPIDWTVEHHTIFPFGFRNPVKNQVYLVVVIHFLFGWFQVEKSVFTVLKSIEYRFIEAI